MFADIAEIFFSQKTITKDYGLVRVPDSVRAMEKNNPIPTVLEEEPLMQAVVGQKSEDLPVLPVQAPTTSIWENFNIDEKINDKLKP